MVTPATWIRQNMFSSMYESPKQVKPSKRPLTAAEIKVQQSLEKLSIPEWYLNNSSKPPKILMNDTPIESRPPSWKSGTYKKKTATSTPMTVRKYDGSPKSNYGASLNSSYHSPRVIDKPQPTNLNNTVGVLIETSLDKRRELRDTGRVAKLKKSNNISKSFPKISPSRKIQNINLVFPPKKLQPNERIDPSLERSIQKQLDKSEIKITNMDNYPDTSILDTTYVKDNETDDEQSTNLSLSILDNSTWLYKQSSKDYDQDQSLLNDESQTFDDSYTPRTFNNTFGKYLHLCNTSNIRSQSFLKTIDEDNEASRPTSPPSVNLSTATFTKSKKKPAVQEEEFDTSGNISLVEDIIEELRKKCKVQSTTGVTPGSRNFVKKLVQVLEKSILDDQDNSMSDGSKSNPDNEYDDDDIESALEDSPSSHSVSLKNSDNEDIYSRTSSSPDYNWSMQANVNFEESKNDVDEEVFWIPVPKDLPKLPRTSSLLSMNSRSSSRSSSNKSPCVSPIRVGHGKAFNYPENRELWSSTYKTNRLSKQLFRIAEAGPIDSGYSDRSRRSSVVGSFLSELETTQTASETESTYNSLSRNSFSRNSLSPNSVSRNSFSRSSLPRNCLAAIHRRHINARATAVA